MPDWQRTYPLHWRGALRQKPNLSASLRQQIEHRPSGITYCSTIGRTSLFNRHLFEGRNIDLNIEMPRVGDIAPSFIASKWCLSTTFRSPVSVQKISPIWAASIIGITLKPSITASRAGMDLFLSRSHLHPSLGPDSQTSSAPSISANDKRFPS